MRFARTLALVGVGLLWLACGPVVLLVAAVSLGVPQVRRWLRPTRRVVLAWVAGVVALAGLAYLVPAGWLPLPPGPGHVVTPGYVGRPARVAPVDVTVPTNPHVAPDGATTWTGPSGDSPHVTTRSYGVAGCRRIAFDSHGRLVTLCGAPGSPVLRLVDPGSLRQLAAKELPSGSDRPCAGSFYLDDRDRAVVATNDRRLLVIRTDDADGDPDLTTLATVALDRAVPDDDCVVGVQPDWQGRVWFVSRGGRVGVVDDGTVRTLDLAEPVEHPLTVGRDGVYVVTAEALYRIGAGPAAKPVVAWRTAHDAARAPVVLASGQVAVVEGTDPGTQVVLHRAADGEAVCSAGVFDDDADVTEAGLVAAGNAVLVQNGSEYGGPLSTVLGRGTPGGLALVDSTCDVTWTSDLDVPSSPPAVSLASGLAFAWAKRHSWLGVDAWYLGAVDLRTGRTIYSVRTGLTPFADPHHGVTTLGPDGSVYAPVLGGLVRVRDAHAG